MCKYLFVCSGTVPGAISTNLGTHMTYYLKKKNTVSVRHPHQINSNIRYSFIITTIKWYLSTIIEKSTKFFQNVKKTCEYKNTVKVRHL